MPPDVLPPEWTENMTALCERQAIASEKAVAEQVSRRDYFAAAALTGLLARGGYLCDEAAIRAAIFADALLKALGE